MIWFVLSSTTGTIRLGRRRRSKSLPSFRWKFPMTSKTLADRGCDNLPCGICNGESGGNFIGVASVPGAPLSVAWCSECLSRNAAPSYVFEHDFIFVAEGDVEKL